MKNIGTVEQLMVYISSATLTLNLKSMILINIQNIVNADAPKMYNDVPIKALLFLVSAEDY